jgi:hypothetical protein
MQNNNNGSFVPAIIYNNIDINQSQNFSDNKGKAGIHAPRKSLVKFTSVVP